MESSSSREVSRATELTLVVGLLVLAYLNVFFGIIVALLLGVVLLLKRTSRRLAFTAFGIAGVGLLLLVLTFPVKMGTSYTSFEPSSGPIQAP